MKNYNLTILALFLAIPLLQAGEPAKEIGIKSSPFTAMSAKDDSVILTLRGNWLVRRTSADVEAKKAGEKIILKSDSDLTLIERHTQIVVRYVADECVILATTFDGRSFGKDIKEYQEILKLKPNHPVQPTSLRSAADR